MLTAIHRINLLPTLVMLLALAGMTLSVIGEASSHGVAGLAEAPPADQKDHSHSHDFHNHGLDEKPENYLHHDSGSHTHESADQLIVHLAPAQVTPLRQTAPLAGDSPRSFRYRLDRPPKAFLTV